MKLQLTTPPFMALMIMADGNPGAATALVELIKEHDKIDPDSALGAMGCLFQLEDYGIKGTDIYVLYSDICNKNISHFVGVLRSVQLGFFNRETLKDAASRQDYSGRDMVPVIKLYNQVKKQLPNFDNQTQQA